MIREYVEAIVLKALTKTFGERGKITPPDGFNAAEQFRGASQEWVVVPYNGHPVIVKLRVLGAGEFPEVTLLEFVNKPARFESAADKIEFRNTLEFYCRHALIEPSFEYFEKAVWGGQGRVREMRARLDELKQYAETYELNGQERAELEELEVSLGYCLPLDTMRAIASWCECLDVVDTKKLKPEDLIAAYSMSQHYHNRASDNINGGFLTHTRKEFDLVAAKLWHDKYGVKK